MNGAPTAPPAPPRPGPGHARRRPATWLHLGRIALLLLVVGGALAAGTAWLLATKARPTAQTVDQAIWPAWMAQKPTYAAAEPLRPTQVAATADPNAALLAKLSALEAEMARLRLEQDALKKRPTGTTIIQQGQPQAAKATPPSTTSASMLFVEHQLKEPEAPKAKLAEYLLAPGSKLPCIVETAINSDVEGVFTAKVSTNVYDTATGRHLLTPEGSTIVGHDQSQSLLYGNERLPTISLTLSLPDGRSVDLGQAPITDQQGTIGLTGRVNNHWGRLFGAVFIGGALRGGMQAIQTGIAQAGGAGQVTAGIGTLGSQAVHQRAGRALDTRPTIDVDAGQLCHVLLTKPLHLPALWQ